VTDPTTTAAANTLFTRVATTPSPHSATLLIWCRPYDWRVLAVRHQYSVATASITKLMTATLVFDQLATSTHITITPQMFVADPQEATLVVNEHIR